MTMVRVNIDGREVEVDGGLNLIEAARKIGVHIPHFCYHPGLGVDGNCRMCMVEVEGMPKPAIACNTAARDLLTKDGVRKVFTTTPRVKELQAAVLEFLFLNHPLDCPICDQSGECYLQDYYMGHGQYQSRLDTPKVHKRKVVPVGPRVMLDAERCVLCSRCVRFCDDVTGTGELRIVNRGNRAEITTWENRPLENDYSLNTVDICPVGALTSRDFRFRKRVWLLSAVKSLCTGCARGCNIFLEHAEGKIYRYRPRENMDVNRWWMCDPGRLGFHVLNDERLEAPMRGDADALFSEALAEAAGAVKAARSGVSGVPGSAGPDSGKPGPAKPASGGAFVLVSPASSVETLYAAKRFAFEVLGGAPVAGIGTRPQGIEDRILRLADPYPNTSGLRLLGLERDPEESIAGGGDLLIVIEDDPLGLDQRPTWREYFKRYSRVLYLGTHENETSRAASLALPVTPHSECDGTFVNAQGRIQRFRKGVVPRGDGLWAPELLRRIAGAAGITFGWTSLARLWEEMAADEPSFAGCDPNRLGDTGQLARAPAGASLNAVEEVKP